MAGTLASVVCSHQPSPLHAWHESCAAGRQPGTRACVGQAHQHQQQLTGVHGMALQHCGVLVLAAVRPCGGVLTSAVDVSTHAVSPGTMAAASATVARTLGAEELAAADAAAGFSRLAAPVAATARAPTTPARGRLAILAAVGSCAACSPCTSSFMQPRTINVDIITTNASRMRE